MKLDIRNTTFNKIVIVGGGFYGCSLAIDFAKKGSSVVLVEMEDKLLGRSSYHNQARVHGGYHYPRSFMTGVRSRYNFNLFTKIFADAIKSDFTKLYAIANTSKVTSKQFFDFCKRIDSPIVLAQSKHRNLFSNDTVEAVFEVQEYAFDAAKLAHILSQQLSELGVEVILNAKVDLIQRGKPVTVSGQLKNSTMFQYECDKVLSRFFVSRTFDATI